MTSDANDADGWRKLAADARAAAEKVTDSEAKRELSEIAERDELLAARAEKRPKKDKTS